MSTKRRLCLIACLLMLSACSRGAEEPHHPLFTLADPQATGITFQNTIVEGEGHNILESEFFFNGGGVAAGDINNNGLPDLFFTANTGQNALYLNLGDHRFRDITAEAGLKDTTGWTAGTAMVDINGNGLLDLYVCKAGNVDVEDRKNKLYINNGDLTFTEKAAEYGLDDPGYCTQAVFFDYDRDGDLDVFIVNYSVRRIFGFDIRTIRDEYDPYAGDKLYRNNGNGTFSDVSQESGIIQNPLGFGLSATVSDLNNNGWPDIYVANDFMERDYMYINQGDGTFRDEILYRTDVTSYFSMGGDIADVTNDGLPDIAVVDMLPHDRARRKVFKTPDYGIYDQLVAAGYHRKNMRNVLQLNNGDGTFTEIGQLAGIAKTDWSWATLIADYDNDGKNDVFITNGFPRFYTDLDYLNNVLWKEFPDENLPDDPQLRYWLTRQMQEVQLPNFAFKNKGDLVFDDVSERWGVNQLSTSHGAAYVDLNNDGALDLVINNINEPPHILINNARRLNDNAYLKVRLKGGDTNTFGIGARVRVTGSDGSSFFRENFPVRGYQSSVDPTLHFGLGGLATVEVEVVWPDQSREVRQNVAVNQTITLDQSNATLSERREEPDPREWFVLLDERQFGLDFVHEESFFQDRITTPLMPHTLSNLGPALATADVNGDGLSDIYVGGGKDQPAALFLQQADGTFARANVQVFEEHAGFEDTDAVFFDANGNGYPDLYVVSGGNHSVVNGPLYQDRLYLNDGFGNFTHAHDALPAMHSSGGVVTVVDIDGDGEPDLFVGGRVLTGSYPIAPRSYLLENNGGKFADVTSRVAPELVSPGMVTDAVWADIDSDGKSELIITGEWMPIRVFKSNGNARFSEITDRAGLSGTAGWWNVLKTADLDGNGHLDLIAGNRGLNASLMATPQDPVILYAGDFSGNGRIDPIITEVEDGERYPVADRDLLLRQLPHLAERFPTYASYSSATIDDILSRSQRREAAQFVVHTFASTVFKNDGSGTFQAIPLPRRAQVAPIFDMVVADVDGDGIQDILVAGNNFGTRPEIGPMASQGLLLTGDGAFGFAPHAAASTGFYAIGDVRKLEVVPTRFGPLVITGRYGDPLSVHLYPGLQEQVAVNE